MPDEAAKTGQLAGRPTIQNDYAYYLLDFIADDPDWLNQVCVLGEDESLMEQPSPCIVDEVAREIDIGTFFFAVFDKDVRRTARFWSDEWPPLLGNEKFPW